MGKYRTRDQDEATVLFYFLPELFIETATEKLIDQHGKVYFRTYFYFSDDAECAGLMREFENGELLVDPKKYSQIRQDVRHTATNAQNDQKRA